MQTKFFSLMFVASLMAVAPLMADSVKEEGTKQEGIVQHEAPGNLEVTHTLECIGIDKIKSEYTPADLYPAVAKCVMSENYDKAAEAFVVAGAFGRFDKKRVTDESAHQAMSMLLQNVFAGVSDERKDKFRTVMKERFGGDEIDTSICPKLRSLGHPTYYPCYMIQHGMGAFLPDDKPPLVEGFKADEAWNQIIQDSVGCPQK